MHGAGELQLLHDVVLSVRSPDGKSLAVAGVPYGNGKLGALIHMVGLETGQVEKVFKGHQQIVTRLAFSPAGKRLAVGLVERGPLDVGLGEGRPRRGQPVDERLGALVEGRSRQRRNLEPEDDVAAIVAGY